MLIAGDQIGLFALLAIVALIAGVVALRKGRLLLGVLCALAMVYFGAPLVLLLPGVDVRFPLMENEAAAIGDCRSVGSAEVAYASSNGGFFGYLSCLGTPTSCGFAAGMPPFIDSSIASLNVKRGYARSFVAGPPGSGKPDPGVLTFVYVATPVAVRETGSRGFAVDHTGLICFTTDGTIPPIVNGALSPACSPLK